MLGQLNDRISFRLGRLAIILALLIGSLFASVQIYLDFLDEEASREGQVQEMLVVAQPAAVRAVLRLDSQLAKEVALGLMQYNFIVSVEIVDDLSRTMAMEFRQNITASSTSWLTRIITFETVENQIDLPLNYSDQKTSGKLIVIADHDIYLSYFYERSIITLVSALLHTFTLAFLLMTFFHYILDRPLRDATKQIKKLDPAAPHQAAINIPANHNRDEIGQLVTAVNMLIKAKNKLMEEQEYAQKRISIARDELEFRVNDRTAELKHEIRERLRAEEQLKEANIQLEDRVEDRTKELSEEIERHKSTLIALSGMKEVADAANRAKSTFLANMSHELRTPLNAIVGFTTIMDEEMFGPVGNVRYKQYVKDIKDSSTHLSEILGNILDLAKVEAGELTLNEDKFDVGNLITTSSKMFVVMAAEANISIKHIIPENLPLLLADELRIKQIVINLVSNSLKFTPSGGVITIACVLNPNGGLVFYVQDTGEGIPEDKLQKILEPFAQVEGSNEKSYQGVGLGLSLSKSLAELHQGKLWVESQLNVGTKVFVEFPKSRTV